MSNVALLAVALVAFCGLLVLGWWASVETPAPVTREPQDRSPIQTEVEFVESQVAADLDLSTTASILSHQNELSDSRLIRALAAIGDRAAYRILIDHYVSWSGDSARLESRRRILATFAEGTDEGEGFHALLAAVAGDQISVEDDPLWSDARSFLSHFFEDRRFRDHGRRLLVMSQSTRARRLITASIFEHGRRASEVEFPSTERHAYASHLVDEYYKTDDAGFRSDIQRGIASISDDRIALALTLPLDSDALENERRALGADPEGATAAIRAVSEGLVVDAVRPDVTTEAFVSAVDMLKVLDPGALRSLAGRATILETSEEARAHWESAMREAGQ